MGTLQNSRDSGGKQLRWGWQYHKNNKLNHKPANLWETTRKTGKRSPHGVRKKSQRLTSKSYCKGAWIYLNQIEHSEPHGTVKNNRAIMQPLRKHFRWGWYQQGWIVKQKDQKKYTGQVEPSKNQCHSRVIVQTSKDLISEKRCQSFNTTGK